VKKNVGVICVFLVVVQFDSFAGRFPLASRQNPRNVAQCLNENPVLPPEPEKNPAAVALGKLGGLKGGNARAAKLSTERKVQIAKDAAKARWKSKL